MRKFGLPKHCLLRKNTEFEAVYRSGTRLHGKGFSIIYRDNDKTCSRIGISVSRKIKGAVVRNRIKRIFKESFRLQRAIYPQEADIIIAVRPDFALESPMHINQALVRLNLRS